MELTDIMIPERHAAVRVLQSGQAMTLTFSCPEKGNALSSEMVESLLIAIADAAKDGKTHTLILRGEGRHFCTGFDLSNLEHETDASLLSRFVRIEQLLDIIWRAPMRTVAFAQGRVTGAGADLLVACDHRILAPNATISFPGGRFGLVLGSRRLAQRLGADQAIRILSAGEQLTAADAYDKGLATELFDGSTDEWTEASLPTVVIGTDTLGMMRKAVDDQASDSDLAALVRSAAQPGLKQRIVGYREAQIAKAAGQ